MRVNTVQVHITVSEISVFNLEKGKTIFSIYRLDIAGYEEKYNYRCINIHGS